MNAITTYIVMTADFQVFLIQCNCILFCSSYKYDVNSIIADFSVEPTPTKMDYHVEVKFQHISVSILVKLNSTNTNQQIKT